MKLPLRLTGVIVLKAIELGFDVAMAIDGAIDRWRNRKPKGLSHKDVDHIQSQIDRATRQQAKTRVLPGREKAPWER